MSTAVRALLKKVEKLTDKELLSLEDEVRRQREARTDAALAPLRVFAKDRGITQADIERACEEVRYGTKARKH